jgi:hypothetical protein
MITSYIIFKFTKERNNTKRYYTAFGPVTTTLSIDGPVNGVCTLNMCMKFKCGDFGPMEYHMFAPYGMHDRNNIGKFRNVDNALDVLIKNNIKDEEGISDKTTKQKIDILSNYALESLEKMINPNYDNE